MSKAGKRVKSGTGSGGAKWEQALLSAQFEEEKWKPNITFVVGAYPEDYSWIDILGATIASGPRKLFSVISKQQLDDEVKELGNPKGKKPKDVPQHYEVCEPCKMHLDQGTEIPLALLSRLLKYKLLSIKDKDLKRRDQEKKRFVEDIVEEDIEENDNKDKTINNKEKKTAEGKDKRKGSGKGKDAPKSGKGKGGGKKTPEPPSAKEGSKLRKRGEEDDEGKYIDDEPDDGANHYIIIYGFHNPHLFAHLSELGINVQNIIKLGSQDYSQFEKKEEPIADKDDKALGNRQGKVTDRSDDSKDSGAEVAEELERNAKLKFKKELKGFWRDVLKILQRQPQGSKLHDIARKDYEVKSLIIPENLEDPEQKNTFGLALFEDVACMIYDLIDYKRQYLNYLDNLKLLHVPVFGQPSAPPPEEGKEKGAVSGAPTPAAQQAAAPSVPSIHPDQFDEKPQVDMRYYNDLMNCIPQESVSVPLVMHCMLEQVVATEENKDPPSEQLPPRRKDGLNTELASHISGLAFKLALTEDEHQMLTDVFDLPERPPDTPNQPLLMNFHDNISQRCQHLQTIFGFNPEAVEKEMLDKLPFSHLAELPRPTSTVAKERAARLQELIHFCATGGLSQSEIDRAFKQFVFECMDLASTDPNGFIITRDSEGVEHSAIPWDDPYPFFKGMIPHHEKQEKEPVLPISTPSEERSGSITESDLIDYSLPGTPSSISDPVDLEAIPSTRPSRPMASRPDKASISQSQSNLSVNKDNLRQSRAKKRRVKSAATPTPLDRPTSAPKEDDSKTQQSDNKPGSRPSTAESKKGILRSTSRSSSPGRPRSRSNSVHFEKDDEGHPVRHIEKDDEEIVEPEPDKTTEESMNEIVDAQKRILDQWCFAEHYDRHVILQVFRDAMYKLPFIDTYYNKRDHSLMVVLHNPHSQELQNHVDWHTELHSNLGFRNYLEYVSESVADFNKEEEAKYQAKLLSQELDKLRSDEEASLKTAEKARAKSAGKKSPGRGKSPKGSRSSSQERASAAGDNMFVRANSLKAWKDEQDRLKAEEEEKEREKSAKRTKSAQKKAEKEEKDKKRGESRGSAKSKASKEPEAEPTQEEGQGEDETYWPFTGYDVGNNLIHVSGITTTLFPSDGGQIRSERTEFVQGTTSVMSSVLKDGHTFTIHIIDPKEPSEDSDDSEEVDKPEVEKADMEKSEKDESASTKDSVAGSSDRKSASIKSDSSKKLSVSAFGSITATMVDGMTLALSQFGPAGESPDGKKYEPPAYVPPPSTPVPHPPPSPSKSKKGGDRKSAVPSEPVIQQPVTDDEEKEEEKEEKRDEEKPIEQSFQQLYVTCPDGLNVKYFLESSVGMKPITEDDRRLLVKQSYPFKTKGEQSCEAQRKKYALTEISRIMTSEGTVVKNMVDGSIEVLYADGTVSVHTGTWPLVRSRSASPNRAGSARSQTGKTTAAPKASKGTVDKTADGDEPETPKKGSWVTTYPNGEKVAYKGDGTMDELKAVMICLASDPETNQTMATRDDHVITISYPDGTTIVEHADGTRITTYYRQSQVSSSEEYDEGENKEYETQIVKFVKVECPAYATVEFNCTSSENLTIFGSGTTINVFPDGYYMLHHYDGGRVEVDTEGTVTYYPRPNKTLEQLLPDRDLQYVLRHNADILVEMVDLDGNIFNVKYNGDFQVMTANGDALSESSLEGDKKLTTYKEHAPRFFILHGDGSGTELYRYQNVAEYITNAEQSPATAVLKDPLPDYPGVTGITILRPYLGGPSEKWFKGYDQESIIPPGIRTRDLTALPPKEYKTPGPKFGTNVGQGLSVGAAVRAPVRIPILKCPKVLELRQLVQYKPVGESLREILQNGLKDYAEYVTERNKTSEYMQPQDPRTDEERIHAADLQELAMQSKQKLPEYERADMKEIYEKATSPPAPSPPPTPISKRTKADWERDQREVAMELEGKVALRNKKIPTYFDSEFGKAFLLSQAKDIDEMLRQLSEDPRKDGTEAVRGESSSQSDKQPISPVTSAYPARSLAAVTSVHSDRSSTSPVETVHPKQVPDTPTSYAVYAETVPSRGGVRPGNPTPVHATGQGSPAPLRPHNPTPSHANKTGTGRPINPTPKQAGGGLDSPSDLPSQLDYPIIQEQPTLEEEDSTVEVADGEAELVLTRSLKVNVVGEPRKDPVPLPRGLKGGKPGAIPNTKYTSVEDPVRRRVNNSVVAGATVKGQTQLAQMRGLILLPDEVDFGILKEGNRYGFTVFLKNTGVDSCRYKLKQPPPATGLRIVYNPGPIAAGMKAELDVELYAIAVGVEGESGVGSVRHDLEIVTETDILFLPISATVLTAHAYDNRNPNHPQGGKSPGTRLVSTKPPSTTGIIRPRREPFQGSGVSTYVR